MSPLHVEVHVMLVFELLPADRALELAVLLPFVPVRRITAFFDSMGVCRVGPRPSSMYPELQGQDLILRLSI